MILNLLKLLIKISNYKICLFFIKNIYYRNMTFLIKHFIAIIILMTGTFYIGYWFGKNRNNIKILIKKYIRQN